MDSRPFNQPATSIPNDRPGYLHPGKRPITTPSPSNPPITIIQLHPDDREAFLAAREAVLNPADPKPFTYAYRIIRRDGTVRWVETHALAFFEDAELGGQLVRFVGALQDITERKEREEREHLLMREVDHRAKNMLSVVEAIAHQTATRSPEDFIGRFSERIQALSANQDLLIKSAWHGVEIENLARAQLAPFADLIGSRIAVCGPTSRLSAASAQAVGLALHELTPTPVNTGYSRTIRGVWISAGRSTVRPSR